MDDSDDEPQQTRPSQRKLCLSWISLAWIKSPMGLLKMVEFVTLLMGIIFIGSVTEGERTSREFFIFVMTAGWVFVLITLILYILDVYQRLPGILTDNFVLFIACAIGVAMLLISSVAMMARNSDDNNVLTGGAFGLISMILVIFETVYYLVRWRKGASNSSPRENPIVDDMDY